MITLRKESVNAVQKGVSVIKEALDGKESTLLEKAEIAEKLLTHARTETVIPEKLDAAVKGEYIQMNYEGGNAGAILDCLSAAAYTYLALEGLVPKEGVKRSRALEITNKVVPMEYLITDKEGYSRLMEVLEAMEGKGNGTVAKIRDSAVREEGRILLETGTEEMQKALLLTAHLTERLVEGLYSQRK